MALMKDDKAGIDKSENVKNPEIVECGICGYHYQKYKKCPQCSMKKGHERIQNHRSTKSII